MPDKPRILGIKTLARTRVFHIQQLDLRFSNGTTVQYERLAGGGPGAVLIVPMPDPDTVLLVREYAGGTERYELALPKGRIEKDEDVLGAAAREMMEEVGYGAHALEKIASMTLAPGYSGYRTHVVLARDLYEHRLPGDEPEEIEVVPWSLREMERLLERDDFTEARSIAALFLVRERLGRG